MCSSPSATSLMIDMLSNTILQSGFWSPSGSLIGHHQKSQPHVGRVTLPISDTPALCSLKLALTLSCGVFPNFLIARRTTSSFRDNAYSIPPRDVFELY